MLKSFVLLCTGILLGLAIRLAFRAARILWVLGSKPVLSWDPAQNGHRPREIHHDPLQQAMVEVHIGGKRKPSVEEKKEVSSVRS